MNRTRTKPPTDRMMWRKLLARSHPNAGGDNELFEWTNALHEHVAGDAIEKPNHAQPRRTTNADSNRVAFLPGPDFEERTARALAMAERVPGPYARLLGLLVDCKAFHHGPLAREQERGASYKRLAAIAYEAGFGYDARQRFYRLAEDIHLADRHAGHILARLKRSAA